MSTASSTVMHTEDSVRDPDFLVPDSQSSDSDSSVEIPFGGRDTIKRIRVISSAQSDVHRETQPLSRDIQLQESEESATVPTNSGEETSGQNVMTPSTNNVHIMPVKQVIPGRRTYDKRYYCLYCEKPYAKIKSHLITQHADMKEVVEMQKQSDKMERNRHLVRLRNLGNHKHNCTVLQEGKGSVIVVYRPSSTDASSSDYGPCSHCYGYYEKSQLWKHCKSRCVWKPSSETNEKRVVTKSSLLLPVPDFVKPNTHAVLSHMRKDEVYRAATNDKLILQLAHKLTAKHYHEADRHEHIRCKVREMGRLLVDLRQHQIQSIADALHPMNFDAVVSSVRRVAGFVEDSNSYTVPSLALKLGHLLKKCAGLQIAEALRYGYDDVQKNAEAFMHLCEMEWSSEVSSSALKTLKDKKLNKVTMLPLAEDILKLTKHLAETSATAIEVLHSSIASQESKTCAWLSLTESTLAQLILFNRRRAGEVSKMTVDTFKAAVTTTHNSDMVEHLSPIEMHLCSVLTRVEIIGKCGKHVPVLLTAAFKNAVDIIIEKRKEGAVLDSNVFVFARPKSGQHLRGSDVIRKYASNCTAKFPHALRSTALRKHVASLSQVLNLKDNELDLLAQFLGHDIRVHREYYRLPSDVLQTAKVAKILIAMESGQQQQLTGQSLSDVNVNLNEEINEEGGEADGDVSDSSCDECADSTEPVAPSTTSHHKLSVDDDSDEAPVKKRRKIRRQPWTDKEQDAVKASLAKYFFIKNKLPGKHEIDQCIAAHPELSSRSWKNVKDFVRNYQQKHVL